MKKIEFKTGKGEFILVDSDSESKVKLPIGIEYTEIGRVKLLTEEQFSGVVDHVKWNFTSGGGQTVYRNYTNDKHLSMCIVTNTAKDSFDSLINSLGHYLFENPYQYDWDELCRYGHGDFSKDGKSSYELYTEADSKIFYNPILLKKI